MKLIFTGVLYNNFSDFLGFVDSVNKAFENKVIDEDVSISINVVNNGDNLNSLQKDELSQLNHNCLHIDLIEGHGNIGYFPGIYLTCKGYSSDFDFFVVCNFDLKISENFFTELAEENRDRNEVIAPKIFSLSENKDRNPKIMNRPSCKAMLKYRCLYAIPYLHYFYKKYFYGKKKVVSYYNGVKMYAPHGSFIIIKGCHEYLDKILNYPVFLFGEEIHVGEIAKNNQIPVIYNNRIKVLDSDHASTSLQKEGFIRKCNLQAINYLIKSYW